MSMLIAVVAKTSAVSEDCFPVFLSSPLEVDVFNGRVLLMLSQLKCPFKLCVLGIRALD